MILRHRPYTLQLRHAFGIASNTLFKAYSQNLFGDETQANPYHYGHLPEVVVNPDGTGTLTKHYCLGRISHELIQVMPDKIGRAHV